MVLSFLNPVLYFVTDGNSSSGVGHSRSHAAWSAAPCSPRAVACLERLFFSSPSDPATFLLMPSRSTTVSRMKSKSDKVMPASLPCLVSIFAFFCLAGTCILLDVFQGLF